MVEVLLKNSAHRLDEAGVLTVRIGNNITRQNKICLKHTSSKTNSKDIRTAAIQLTGRQRDVGSVDGVTAESLNTHYAFISTQAHYTQRPLQSSVTHSFRAHADDTLVSLFLYYIYTTYYARRPHDPEQ